MFSFLVFFSEMHNLLGLQGKTLIIQINSFFRSFVRLIINLFGQTLTPTFVKTRNKKTFLRLKLLYLAPRVESESTTLLTPCKKKKVDFFIARSSLEKLEFLGLIRLSIVSSCYPGRRTKKKTRKIYWIQVISVDTNGKFIFQIAPFATASCFAYTRLHPRRRQIRCTSKQWR